MPDTRDLIANEQRILEAHGLWELAVVRVAAIAEPALTAGNRKLLAAASKDEREAFLNWQRVSRECGA